MKHPSIKSDAHPSKSSPKPTKSINATPTEPSPEPVAKPELKTNALVALHPFWTQIMTPKDLARFLRVSPTTLRKMYIAGELPYRKINGQVRFLAAEVLSALPVKGGK